MAATLPLQRKKPSEADIEAVINKGGKTTKESTTDNPDAIKFLNMKLTAGVLERIRVLREKRPRKIGSPKLGVSAHDWILEAIVEKLEREEK